MHVLQFFLWFIGVVLVGSLLVAFFQSEAFGKLLTGVFFLVLVLIPIAGIVLIVIAFTTDSILLGIIGLVLLIFGGAYWAWCLD